MKVLTSNEFYEISILDEFAILKIKEHVFDLITDIKLSGKLIEFLNGIDHNRDIKALIYYNDPGSFVDEKYDNFIGKILGQNPLGKESDNPCFRERNIRFREINILNNLIRNIASLQSLVISGIQGNVVTPFIGASLVADFRYATENAVLSMIHNKYGLHPSGGLPFFLSNLLHHSKAMEIQMTDKIDAKKAYNLGLVTKLLPAENFIENIIKEVRVFTRLKYGTITDTKRLTSFSRKFLNEYFEFESTLLNL
ncbi:MAG: enoyl-CoA hydratase/isomerase family protein [Bacteroidales bacterium]|nr:enoyl-CoA hydratase/isomerase family protein [Bacteroidales bacterium]